MDALSTILSVALISSAIRVSTSILLAALGENFAENSGVLNLGTEGVMNLSALTAFLISYAYLNVGYGLVGAIFAGIALSLLFSFFTITLKSDQVVTGIALTLFGTGFSFFIYRQFFGTITILPQALKLNPLDLGFLTQIPVLGEPLFGQYILTYIAWAMIPVSYFILYKTRYGLNIRSVGENPKAAESLGINVVKTRYLCLILHGALAGLGGAFLTMAQFNSYLYNMVAGRGFVAVAIVIFGRWNPVRILIGALIFGIAEALGLTLQALGTGIPAEAFLVLPYLLTVIILPIALRRAEVPRALGVPYSREEL